MITSIMDRFKLDGNKAIVTGGASGLGEGMAIALAEAGADVAISDVNLQSAQRVADKIRKLGRNSFAIKTNVTRSEDVREMVRKVLKQFGRIDILVTSAGIGEGPVPPEKLSETEWRKIIDVNLAGIFLCNQEAGKVMIRQKRGKIVNISSISGTIVNKGQAGLVAYCPSKAGVISLTKVLAVRWAKYNINVNCISPGYMLTPQSEKMLSDPKRYKFVTDLVPMKRIGNPEDLAGAVVFLTSEASSFITGHDLRVDGGHTAW